MHSEPKRGLDLFGCVAQVEPGMPLLLLLFACTYCCMHALPFDQQVTYRPDLGEVQEYFLGSGGLINLYGSVTSEQLPGVTEAVAQVRSW